MFKRTIAPVIIGIIASFIFVCCLVIVPGIVVLLATLPVFGTILILLTKLTLWGTGILDFFYAFVALIASLFFIAFATSYDKKYPYYNAAKKAATTEGALLSLYLFFSFIFIVFTQGISWKLFASITPYLILLPGLFGYEK